MRNLRLLDRYRVRSGAVIRHYGWEGDETCGVFVVPSPIDNSDLRIIASSGLGWDHVSVSRANRCPNWPEMKHVYDLFFSQSEVAIEYHIPREDRERIDFHPYCLHLWRPNDGREIPRPPAILVGPVETTA